MKSIIDRIFRRSANRVGQGIRGRIHKISIVAGGEVSIVIRCGLDEPRARQVMQGGLIELFETRAGAAVVSLESPKVYDQGTSAVLHPTGVQLDTTTLEAQPAKLSAEELRERQHQYDHLFAEIYGKAADELTEEEMASIAVFNAHTEVIRQLDIVKANDGGLIDLGRVSDTGKQGNADQT